jgi:hypothetical protein
MGLVLVGLFFVRLLAGAVPSISGHPGCGIIRGG